MNLTYNLTDLIIALSRSLRWFATYMPLAELAYAVHNLQVLKIHYCIKHIFKHSFTWDSFHTFILPCFHCTSLKHHCSQCFLKLHVQSRERNCPIGLQWLHWLIIYSHTGSFALSHIRQDTLAHNAHISTQWFIMYSHILSVHNGS